jgi:hypothetical protein
MLVKISSERLGKLLILKLILEQRVNEVFIFLFFLSDVGRYLISPFPRPRMLKLEINVITEISVVPIPTCSAEYKRVFIIQKKKPNTAPSLPCLTSDKLNFYIRSHLPNSVKFRDCFFHLDT